MNKSKIASVFVIIYLFFAGCSPKPTVKESDSQQKTNIHLDSSKTTQNVVDGNPSCEQCRKDTAQLGGKFDGNDKMVETNESILTGIWNFFLFLGGIFGSK